MTNAPSKGRFPTPHPPRGVKLSWFCSCGFPPAYTRLVSAFGLSLSFLELKAARALRYSLSRKSNDPLFTFGSRAAQCRKSGNLSNLSGALSGGRNLPAPHAPWRGASFVFLSLRVSSRIHMPSQSEVSEGSFATSLARYGSRPRSALPFRDANPTLM